MTDLWVYVAKQIFFVSRAGARFCVKAVTVVLKRSRNYEGDFGRREKDALLWALRLLQWKSLSEKTL